MEAFIAESRRAATRRRNVLTASLAAGLLVALILAGWAYWQQGVAVEQQRIAQQRHVASLAELATSERTRGHLNSALRIAVHATRISFGSDRATEAAASARAALAAAVWQSNWRQLLMVRGLNNISAEFSPDGLHILTTSSDPEKKIQPYTARIWDAISGKELTDIPGNEGRFWLSPDGSRIVAKSNLRTLRTWAFPSGSPLAVLKGHEGEVFTAKFNHDGSRVVTASSDKTARIWDSTTGTELATLWGHADGVWNAVFNPSGNRVVTGSSDKTARIWDTATGKELAVLRGHQAVVNFLSFSPDGMKIVTGSSDYTARIWDVTSATEIKTLQHGAQVTAVTFSPDSSRVLTSSWDKTARIWDATTGKELAVLRGHEEWINSASYNRHGSQITTASNDWTARTWNPETGHEIAVLRGHSSSVFSANFSPDGNRIVTAGTGEIRIWDADSSKERSLLVGHDGSVQSAIFSPDGSRAVTSSNDDKSVRVWDAATGEQLMVLSTNVEINARPFFSADGKRVFIPGVATIGSDGIEGEVRTVVWDTMTGNKLLSLPGRAISFSRDGSRLFGTVKISREGEKDYTEVRVWDAATGKEVSTSNVGDLYVLSFSADGTRFAYYLPDGDSVGIWDVSNGKQLAVLKGHRKTVQSATFSPDGSLIVTTSFDFTARIWQAVTGKEVALLRHRDNVMSGSFTPDGKRIVTAAHDGKARIWDVASGTEIAAVAHATHHATFSPDGSSMVTASGKAARIWDVRFATMSTDDLLMEICLRRLQGLTMLTPDEMRMSGYPDNLPLIDVCDGIN